LQFGIGKGYDGCARRVGVEEKTESKLNLKPNELGKQGAMVGCFILVLLTI